MAHIYMLIAIILITAFATLIKCDNNSKVVCYYDYLAQKRTDKGKFTVKEIDSSLCTHIVYSSFGIDDKNKVIDEKIQVDTKDIEDFIAQKGKTKALASIGGTFVNSSVFSSIVDSDDGRKTFVDSVTTFLKKYKFDGVMIDWQWPKGDKDKGNYASLIDKFDEKFANTTYTIGITSNKDPADFDVKKFVSMVDFIIVPALDYSEKSPVASHASPLHLKGDICESGCVTDYRIISGASSMKKWEMSGVNKHKLILSVPFYGRTSNLSNGKDFLLGAKVSGSGPQGPFTKTDGMQSYNEICSSMKENPDQWHIISDNASVTVYAVKEKDKLWVSYENQKTLMRKGQWVKDNGYGGISVNSLSNDDFSGNCHKDKYSLLKSVNEGLGREQGSVPKEIPEPKSETFICSKEGYFRDPNDCQKYYLCMANDLKVWDRNDAICENGRGFDENTKACTPKDMVKECKQ